MILILIVDDHELFRESVARLLETEPDFEIAGHCGTVEQGLEIMRRTPVDVVLLDYDLGAKTAAHFLPQAHGAGFAGRVLMVTAGMSNRAAADLLRDGISGIFLKHGPPARLVEIIRKVAAGNRWIEPQYQAAVAMAESSSETQARGRFTQRERAVLRGVFEGLANKEIADRLQVSESSVKASLQQLFHKTGVRTRSQLVRMTLERFQDEL